MEGEKEEGKKERRRGSHVVRGGRLSHGDHTLDLGLVGQWFEFVDLYLLWLHQQDHWVVAIL
jgi:hypothetical protein